MLTSTVSPEGDIRLPRQVRKALGVEPGEKVVFQMEDHGIRLTAANESVVQSLAGSLRKYARRSRVKNSRAVVRKAVARAAAQEG